VLARLGALAAIAISAVPLIASTAHHRIVSAADDEEPADRHWVRPCSRRWTWRLTGM